MLRRRDDRWQVGLDPARRLLLPAGSSPPDLLEAVALRSPVPAAESCPASVRDTLAAVAREAGDGCSAVLDRRARHVVRVEPFGPQRSAELGQDLSLLCGRSGLRLAEGSRSTTGGRLRATPVVVLLGVGEPPREEVDRHVREQTPHLLVRMVEGRAVVGPFVVPGVTPCLRCLDAHLTDADPSWPLLVEQYVRAVRSGRADGVPEPLDAALAALAVAWAARDLATYAEGGTPTTLASTVELGPRLETVEIRQWPPHPRCGCSWR